jgi:8'-apo-carotenoid 13,14-cleaving dioxygenase
MPAPTDPSIPPSHDVDIDVRGTMPRALSGRMLGIGRDGVVHSMQLATGRVTYRCRRPRTDQVLHHIVGFGSSILALGDDSCAYELSAELDTLDLVDLAGSSRAVAPFPSHDPTTGELHLIARAEDGTQAHVVVSVGALTRRSRPIVGSPNRITDLTLTRGHIIYVGDGFVGIGPRDGEARVRWTAIDGRAPHLVHARDAGDDVVLLVLTPSLERWTVTVDAGSAQREVLDPTPRRFAHCGSVGVDETPTVLWSTGDTTIGHHDLTASRHLHHDVEPHTLGGFVCVPDEASAGKTDGGWLVGFVHDTSTQTSELRVIDAASIDERAIATARIPRLIPTDLRCTWVHSTHT